MSSDFPVVIATSVIRSAHKGDSHGGVYIIDLSDDEVEQVIDWDDCGINFEGRGGDRGLRGIGFYGETILLAASNEIMVYDREFALLDTLNSPYLQSCHETHVEGDMLFAMSTKYDSVLGFDLKSGECVRGHCFRGPVDDAGKRTFAAWDFDPQGASGPHEGDNFHLNTVYVQEDVVYVGGTRRTEVNAWADGVLSTYATTPGDTHNTLPFRDGLLFNSTRAGTVVHSETDGTTLSVFEVPVFPEAELLRNDLGPDHAKQAWGRGLAVHGDLVIAGSSPATLAVHDLESNSTLKTLTISMDVRNAVHGLEVWPF